MKSSGMPGRGLAATSKWMIVSVASFALLSLAPTWLESFAPGSTRFVGAAQADETVNACGLNTAGQLVNNVFGVLQQLPGVGADDYCSLAAAGYLTLANNGMNPVAPGTYGEWLATVPSGSNLAIAGASVPNMSLSKTVGTGYVAYFTWPAGSQRVDDTWRSYSVGLSPAQSSFGFQLGCSFFGSTCPADGAYFSVPVITLDVVETAPPDVTAIGANNLWYQGSVGYTSGIRWVRGPGWSIAYSANSSSGIESMQASLAGQPVGSLTGQPVPIPPPPGCTPDHTQWVQCPASQTWSPTVALSGSGDQQLVLSATSAAQNTSAPSETIHVDSVQPTVALSGPAAASSSAGTQYVTATATVGDSGLGAISCSVDGGPEQSYSSSPAQVPVSGVGTHAIQCTASNRSFNSAGQVAVSLPATFSMDIAAPTASGISFANVIHSLKCKRVEERVKVAGRWVTVRRQGKLVRERRRAHVKRVRVMKCRERFVKRKVIELVKVKRHGKTVVVKRTKVEKVPLPPQAVSASTKRVAFGKGTTVSGILATTDGTAVPGRTVQILTAPNNQLGQWSQAAVVTTGADGTWNATLPPGPSRLVEASYGGDSTTLPSTSNTVTLLVPASIKITITPHRLPWNGVLTVHGHLAGGYVPPDGVAMRVLIGLPHLPHPYLAQSFRTNAAGAFALKFKAFGGGSGVATYPVWLGTTSNESDYAYAKSSGRRIELTFGRRTPKKKKTKASHKKDRKRRGRKRRR